MGVSHVRAAARRDAAMMRRGIRGVRGIGWIARIRGLAAALAVLLAIAAFAPRAHAHSQPFSYADVRLEPSGLTLTLSVHPVDAAAALGMAQPESVVDSALGAAARMRLASILATRMRFEADGRDAALEIVSARPRADNPGVTIEYRSAWARMPGRFHAHALLFPHDSQHQTFVNVYERGRLRRQDVLDAEHTEATFFGGGTQGLLAVTGTFLAAGIHHIFIGPDHILFVIGLLLLGGGIKRILKVITAFTVAHSITLALAAFQLVNPPSRVVEPLIALSIVFVGVENLRWRPGHRDARVLIAFAFGFIHGFGFASVLREFGLPREALAASLFAFNAGVEVGQACIVLAVVPLLGLVRARAPRFAPRLVTAGSVGVVIAGAFWFAQRVLQAS